LILFLTIANTLRAQEKVVAFKINPTAWLSPNFPSYMFGIEVKPWNRWAFSIDYGFQAPVIFPHILPDISIIKKLNLTGKEDVQLSKIKASIVSYPFVNYKKVYFATEFQYIAQQYDRFNDVYYSKKDDHAYIYTSAHINLTETAFALKFGFNTRLSERFYVDLSGGVGARWVTVQYSTVGNTPPNVNYYMTGPEFIEADPYDLHEGNFQKVNAVLTIKLSYLIFKK